MARSREVKPISSFGVKVLQAMVCLRDVSIYTNSQGLADAMQAEVKSVAPTLVALLRRGFVGKRETNHGILWCLLPAGIKAAKE